MMRRGLAVAAALLLFAGCDDSPADPDPSAGASSEVTSGSPTVDPGPVVACPDEILLDPDPALPDEVPEGATSVRLCAAEPGEVPPPIDALTGDVAGVAAAVNEQRLVTRHCTDLQLPAYQLAFGYPDGTRFVVAGRFTGCGELLVGSARRAQARPALRAFVERLRTQRTTTSPPEQTVTPDDLNCARPPSYLELPVALAPDLTVAVLCFGRREHPERAGRVVIPSDDLTTLVASMETDTYSTAGSLGCTFVPAKEHWIVGASAWGDPITMFRGCDGLTVDPAHSLEWAPRGQARSIVRELIAQAR